MFGWLKRKKKEAKTDREKLSEYSETLLQELVENAIRCLGVGHIRIEKHHGKFHVTMELDKEICIENGADFIEEEGFESYREALLFVVLGVWDSLAFNQKNYWLSISTAHFFSLPLHMGKCNCILYAARLCFGADFVRKYDHHGCWYMTFNGGVLPFPGEVVFVGRDWLTAHQAVVRGVLDILTPAQMGTLFKCLLDMEHGMFFPDGYYVES